MPFPGGDSSFRANDPRYTVYAEGEVFGKGTTIMWKPGGGLLLNDAGVQQSDNEALFRECGKYVLPEPTQIRNTKTAPLKFESCNVTNFTPFGLQYWFMSESNMSRAHLLAQSARNNSFACIKNLNPFLTQSTNILPSGYLLHFECDAACGPINSGFTAADIRGMDLHIYLTGNKLAIDPVPINTETGIAGATLPVVGLYNKTGTGVGVCMYSGREINDTHAYRRALRLGFDKPTDLIVPLTELPQNFRYEARVNFDNFTVVCYAREDTFDAMFKGTPGYSSLDVGNKVDLDGVSHYIIGAVPMSPGYNIITTMGPGGQIFLDKVKAEQCIYEDVTGIANQGELPIRY